MMPVHELEKKYAEVIVATGVNLYPGQCLNITTGYKNYEFACTLAEAAYEKGAKFVNIDVVSNIATKVRIEGADVKNLEYVPDFVKAKYSEMCASDWAFVRIDDTEELDVLEGADSEKLGILEKAMRSSRKIFYQNLLKDKISWCVVCTPGPGWAKYVTGVESEEALWDVLKPILRLDSDNPIEAWRAHGENLVKRRKKLNELSITKLMFKAPETDLTVQLLPTSQWHGGPSETLEGRVFTANVPTEEVFTTPDYRKTEGYVKITRPLKVLETMVEGASFTFKEGRVVEFQATKGRDILEKYFAIDEGASYLGEVALVGCDSPLYQSGKIFGSILYDENAASHIALGSGYPSCLSNSNTLYTDVDLKKAGCNTSLVHTDFMLGSEQMQVEALCEDGSTYTIMKNGLFCI